MDSIRSDRNRERLNRLRGWAGNVAAIGLLLLAAWSSRVSAQEIKPTLETVDLPYHTSDIRHPLDPLPNVPADGTTSWRAAVALLADPVDTRLGRSFDIQMSTLIRSFQFDGYVLQSHSLPWKLGDAKPPVLGMQANLPGVLVFRRDLWREAATARPAVAYFVVFVVGESPVFGVQRVAFCRAAVRVRSLNAGRLRADAAEDLPCQTQTDSLIRTPAAGGLVPVLGPMFSGTMSPLAEVAITHGLKLDLFSPSATVDSNDRLIQVTARGYLNYRSFARWQQSQQMQTLYTYLAAMHGICPNSVVVMAEESSFGQGATQVRLGKDAPTRCLLKSVPRRIQFPQNIAAIRAEHAQISQRNKKGDAPLSLLPKRNLELDMQDAGSSPDLPPTYQPSLSSRSDELSLQQLMDNLATRFKPKAVVIVATDVRDRIYMLGVVRQAVPGALPIVLEGDHLLAHPDYRRANRGALMVFNSPLSVCYAKVRGKSEWQEGCAARPDRQIGETRRFSFGTDYAASLFRATQHLLHPSMEVDDAQLSAKARKPPGVKAEPERREPGILSVITLAGTQFVPVNYALSNRQSVGSLIAADLRMIVAQCFVPILFSISVMLLMGSLWLCASSRSGRTILPPVRHAFREAGWCITQGLQRLDTKEPWPYQRKADSQLHRTDRSPEFLMHLLLLAAVGLVLALGWEWIQLLRMAGASGGLSRERGMGSALASAMQLVHGRDLAMAFVLMGFYAWFALLVIGRIDAWNDRCRHHWSDGTTHPGRNLHAQRRYHGTALGIALLLAVPPLLSWRVRDPVTVDHTEYTAVISFLILTACLYFLIQAALQTQRLFHLARVIRDEVVDTAAEGVLKKGWPTPRLIGIAPHSPITVLFRDFDWQALDKANVDWPLLPSNKTTVDELNLARKHWCERTVAEMKFGLVVVRSCLWAAFFGPLIVLAMIHVYPFVYEWQHSAIALGMLTMAFAASAFMTYQAEQAPLIGQMFTQDGAHVSFVDLLKALGGKLLLLLLILAATLAPDLGQTLQNFMGMLKF
ncbi:MAG TPA: hypothetical protein VM469_14115 [Pseudoxanthomonas sp.]|nr:hypothetical protein [Pseudoxanthomonas sp.]